jgi:hypothetical protein
MPVTQLKHRCPCCEKHMHAICGEEHPKASITYKSTCFVCFDKYKKAYKSPAEFMADKKKQPPKTSASVSVLEELSKKQPPEEPSDLSTDDEEAGGVHVVKGKTLDALVITKEMIEVADEIEVEDENLKTKQQKKRAETVALWNLVHCDIISDGEDLYRLRGAKEGQNLTCLRGIAGVSVNKITADELKGFCAAQKISGYKGATKAKMCDLIANQYKDQHLYNGLGRKGMGSDQSNNKRKTTTDKKHSKYLVPMAVTKTGTYYRAINCFLADSTRVNVRALTSTVSKNEMDQGLFAHQRVYEHLLSIYLDKDLQKNWF